MNRFKFLVLLSLLPCLAHITIAQNTPPATGPLQNRPLLFIPEPTATPVPPPTPIPMPTATPEPTAVPTATPIPIAPVVVDPSSTTGIANVITHEAGFSAQILWIDGTANIDTTATPEGIEALVMRAKAAHINTLVFDVKPLSGEVLYDSQIAPHLREWKGKQYDPSFDRLAAIITVARKNGLSVFASMNVFSDGHKIFKSGPGYNRPMWQSVSYNVARAVVASDGNSMSFPSTPDDPSSLGGLSVFSAPVAATSFKPEAVSALVSANGKIIMIGEAPLIAAAKMPDGSRVLTGAGEARTWIERHLHVGDSVTYTATPLMLKTADADWEKTGVFVSPHNAVVRSYEASIAKEIVQNYAVDGIVFDRMRFSNLTTDFSDLARHDFEKTIGHRVAHWPQDIFSYAADPFASRIEGPLFKQWLQFRAATVTRFLNDTSATLRATKPGVQVAVYVGSWYSDYYPVGVNWGSDDFNAAYDWMTPGYYKTGYAKTLDWMTTGCYFPVATRADARAAGADPQATVESAAALSNQVVNDATFMYGGLYVENYRDKPADFARAIAVCKATTQGVMIFDAVHLDQMNWWSVVEQALAPGVPAPNAVADLLTGVRASADAVKGTRPNHGTRATIVDVPISQTP